jgi:hypothetical protein
MPSDDIEDEKDSELLSSMLLRIDQFRQDLRERRAAIPTLDRDIEALEMVLLDARVDFQRINRERSERRKSEAATMKDMQPYDGGHRNLDEQRVQLGAHQITQGLRTATKDLRTALVENALERAKVKR